MSQCKTASIDRPGAPTRDNIVDVCRAQRAVLLAANAAGLRPRQFRVLNAVLAYTATWTRLTDQVTHQQIAVAAGLKDVKVIGEELRSLAREGLIVYQPSRGRGHASTVGLPDPETLAWRLPRPAENPPEDDPLSETENPPGTDPPPEDGGAYEEKATTGQPMEPVTADAQPVGNGGRSEAEILLDEAIDAYDQHTPGARRQFGWSRASRPEWIARIEKALDGGWSDDTVSWTLTAGLPEDDDIGFGPKFLDSRLSRLAKFPIFDWCGDMVERLYDERLPDLLGYPKAVWELVEIEGEDFTDAVRTAGEEITEDLLRRIEVAYGNGDGPEAARLNRVADAFDRIRREIEGPDTGVTPFDVRLPLHTGGEADGCIRRGA